MIMPLDVVLPGNRDVGRTGVWDLPGPDDSTSPITPPVEVRLLGLSTSHRADHEWRGEPNHPGQEYAPKGMRCSACRWFESRIFRETHDRKRFLVHNVGRSSVPGEETYVRLDWCLNAHEVLEVMMSRDPDRSLLPSFTAPAAKVLSQAAGFDTDMRDAWENRAIL